MTFLLDLRLDLTPEEMEHFQRYKLYGFVVYDSDARIQHAYSAAESYEAATNPMTPVPWEPSITDLGTAFAEIAASVWNIGAGVVHDVMSITSLQITLGSLVHGQHVESSDLIEILTVADNVEQAAQYLADAIRVSLTFDGREDLSEH